MILHIKNVINYYETYTERLRSEKKELENENRILKEKLMRYRFYGSTDCKTDNCLMGVTLFTANDYCTICKPEDYEDIK